MKDTGMYAFIVVILLLAYGLLLLFGLLHVAQELITRPSPQLFSYSEFDADQDDDLPGAAESSSTAASASAQLMNEMAKENRYDIDRGGRYKSPSNSKRIRIRVRVV
jgi:hypothetical protein